MRTNTTNQKITKTYMTFKEYLEFCSLWEPNYNLGVVMPEILADVVNNITGLPALATPFASVEASTLWSKYLVNYNQDAVVLVFEDENLPANKNDERIQKWIFKFMAIFARTYDKYKTLINIYDAKKNDLMEDLAQTTKTKFNDTPQDDGTFTGGTYTSNYTESQTTAPGGTVIERLTQINQLWDDIYKQWVREFKGLFFEIV